MIDDRNGMQLLIVNDDRGIRSLAATRDLNCLSQAADALFNLDPIVPVNVCTGFPVNGMPETDGPAGALILCHALLKLGHSVRFVSYSDVIERLEKLLFDSVERIAIPCGRPSDSVLEGIFVTIEICGRISDGTYRNMRHNDISANTPWFESAIGYNALVSIGDGGNEFGMGVVDQAWFDEWGVKQPISTCDYLIPAQVSNWGALGLVAALSKTSAKDLMPNPVEYNQLLENLASAGFVDGVKGKAMSTEDGHPPRTGGDVVKKLRQWAGLAINFSE